MNYFKIVGFSFKRGLAGLLAHLLLEKKFLQFGPAASNAIPFMVLALVLYITYSVSEMHFPAIDLAFLDEFVLGDYSRFWIFFGVSTVPSTIFVVSSWLEARKLALNRLSHYENLYDFFDAGSMEKNLLPENEKEAGQWQAFMAQFKIGGQLRQSGMSFSSKFNLARMEVETEFLSKLDDFVQIGFVTLESDLRILYLYMTLIALSMEGFGVFAVMFLVPALPVYYFATRHIRTRIFAYEIFAAAVTEKLLVEVVDRAEKCPA